MHLFTKIRQFLQSRFSKTSVTHTSEEIDVEEKQTELLEQVLLTALPPLSPEEEASLPDSTKPLIPIIWEKISKIGSKPLAIQALWDEEAFIWPTRETEAHLCLWVVYSHPTDYKADMVYSLGESQSAIIPLLGKYFAQKFDIPFYFPSPNEVDDDCPTWWEQDKGIHCEDCQKLFIPSDMSHRPKDICYPCHLRREIVQDIPSGDSFTISYGNESEFACVYYSYYPRDSNFGLDLLTFWEEYCMSQNILLSDELMLIQGLELEKLHYFMEKQKEELFILYQSTEIESNLENTSSKLDRSVTIHYKDQTYKLSPSSTGSIYPIKHRLEQLLYWRDITQFCIEEEKEIVIIIAKNLTCRDNAFFEFIHSQGGQITYLQLQEKFNKLLSKDEILKTLNKLVIRDYLLHSEKIELTLKGKHTGGYSFFQNCNFQ
ncbi:hypothetical protein QNI19_27310 [Cytophagaceae bacterium DM2B3-1]|uniref:Transcriptional regulator n=1 Tax=Xanthocytophaga flava TaxID=3048013 RepID=A0ABT7CUS9_9BACT|nr:hypothetical protein [Xanthocytophaga flavus]MDJ1496672.1 hypothetical protein [Xanthocytophaga flavus]